MNSPDEFIQLKSFIDYLNDRVDIYRYILHYSDYHYHYINPSSQYSIYNLLREWKKEPIDTDKIHLFTIYRSDEKEFGEYEYNVVRIELTDEVFVIDNQVEPSYRFSGESYLIAFEIENAICDNLDICLTKDMGEYNEGF